MKTLIIDGKTFFIYYDGSIRIYLNGMNLCLDREDIELIYKQVVARDTRLPLFYSAYPGNIHDSKHFETVMDEMFGIVCGLNNTKERLTIVVDKGINSEGNYTWIDEHSRVHFITTYSTYFAQELAAIPLDRFEIADTARNRKLIDEKCQGECQLG